MKKLLFNNCIATNLLHVMTESGTDEMMIVRVLIAQCLSFGIVAWIWRRRKQKVSIKHSAPA